MHPTTSSSSALRPRASLAIACQGGGSHTAFTAGVLKHLLDAGVHQRYQLVGLSGTSGGAICALLAWCGLVEVARGLAEPPSHRLLPLWHDNTAQGLCELLANHWLVSIRRLQDQGLAPAWAANPVGFETMRAVARATAPREEFVDLRTLLEQHIPFARLDQLQGPESPALLLGAVEVTAGTSRVFDSTRERITAEMVLASAAIPNVFPAVQVHGDFYWDGLFAENPPIVQLVQGVWPDEIWVIQINPTERQDVPTTPNAIIDRMNELAGNLSLRKSLDWIEAVNGWLRAGAFTEAFLAKSPKKPITLHTIAMRRDVAESLDYASKLDRHPALIRRLLHHGEEQAAAFLASQERGP
jgi:NTE family protein